MAAKIESLQVERAALVTSRRALSARWETTSAEHLDLLAALGRGRAIDEGRLDDLSAELTEIERQLEIGAAAVASIDREIAGNQQRAELDAHAAQLQRLRELVDEYADLAYQLDAQPFDVTAWLRLRDVSIAGNRLVTRLFGTLYGLPFVNPRHDLPGWMKRCGEEIDRAFNGRYQPNVRLPSDYLDVVRARQRVTDLLQRER